MPLRLLNSRRSLRQTPAPPPTSDIASTLKSNIQHLYVSHITASGIDYAAMKTSPEFASYVSETRRLPHFRLSTLSTDAEKTVFFVNLYNAATQHAVVAIGPPPTNPITRLIYGVNVGYRVDAWKFSLNDMENGILRGNRGISILRKPFGKRDLRRPFIVHKLDPRIHFVLNCAATSCPPVLFLTLENLESTLQNATEAFLKSDTNFRIENGTLFLSRIFDWYGADFKYGALAFVETHVDPQVKLQLDLLKVPGKDVDIQWIPYDWTLNQTT